MDSESKVLASAQASAHIISNLMKNAEFWENQLKILSMANQKHGKAIERMSLQILEEIKRNGKSESLSEAEKMFCCNIETILDRLKQQKAMYERDRRTYIKVRKALRTKLESGQEATENPELAEARSRLDRLTQLLNKSEKDYKVALQRHNSGRSNDGLEMAEKKYKGYLEKCRTQTEIVNKMTEELAYSEVANLVIQTLKDSVALPSIDSVKRKVICFEEKPTPESKQLPPAAKPEVPKTTEQSSCGCFDFLRRRRQTVAVETNIQALPSVSKTPIVVIQLPNIGNAPDCDDDDDIIFGTKDSNNNNNGSNSCNVGSTVYISYQKKTAMSKGITCITKAFRKMLGR